MKKEWGLKKITKEGFKMQEQIGIKKTKDHTYCKGCHFDSAEKCKFKTKCHLYFGEIYKLKIIIKLEEKRF